MVKIAHIIGARPQFIKCAPLLRAFKKHNSRTNNKIRNIIIHTGQHYDYLMSEVFFRELEVPATDYHLGVGSGRQGMQTGQVLQKVEETLVKIKPDACIVYGDTNSTLGGALAAVKLHIPVIHIEAGLRSYDKHMPEEINRILTDHVSALLLCPTENAVANLKKEGFSPMIKAGKLHALKLNRPQVVNVGDIMFDALLQAVEIAETKSNILVQAGLREKQYAVLTIHRAENADNREKLGQLLHFTVKAAGSLPVIFPVHPRTRKHLKTMKNKYAATVSFIEPLGYFDMLKLVRHSALVLTDSGGLQKEAFWLRIPCITLREQTEWVETVQGGWNVLYRDFRRNCRWPNNQAAYYGAGRAAEKIVKLVINCVKRRQK